MRAGFHNEKISEVLLLAESRNPSLIRAGFHNVPFKHAFLDYEESQSLVNEGRFPQEILHKFISSELIVAIPR